MGNKQASASDLAEKNHISEEEVATLLAAFKADGNKKAKPVKLKQFKKTLAEVHRTHGNENFNPEIAEILFAIFDVDKNGKVDVGEFLHGVSVFGSLASDDHSKEEKARMIFAVIDRDGSGKISRGEFRRYLSKTVSIAKALYFAKSRAEGIPMGMRLGIKVAIKIGEGRFTDEVTEQAFKADTDGDGEISLDEWLVAVNAGNNEAIEAFLDPGETIKLGVEKLDEGIKEAGITKDSPAGNLFSCA
jgi:Ca2+-binding EF-hand superfamily protein